jgi:membrane protein implicated in regulation of membrane protease activity
VTIKNAFRTLVSILQGLINLVINLVIVVLPVLLLVVAPIVLVIWLIRRWRRGRKQEQPAEGDNDAGDVQ